MHTLDRPKHVLVESRTRILHAYCMSAYAYSEEEDTCSVCPKHLLFESRTQKVRRRIHAVYVYGEEEDTCSVGFRAF